MSTHTHTHDRAIAERIATRAHLRTDQRGNAALPMDKPSEAYCVECRARVTVGSDGTEYGHHSGHTGTTERCPHRPDCVDPATTKRWE